MNNIKNRFFIFMSLSLSSFCVSEDTLFLTNSIHKTSIFLQSLDAYKVAEFINNFNVSTIQARAYDKRNLELSSSVQIIIFKIAKVIIQADKENYSIEQSLVSDLYDNLIQEPKNQLPKSKL